MRTSEEDFRAYLRGTNEFSKQDINEKITNLSITKSEEKEVDEWLIEVLTEPRAVVKLQNGLIKIMKTADEEGKATFIIPKLSKKSSFFGINAKLKGKIHSETMYINIPEAPKYFLKLVTNNAYSNSESLSEHGFDESELPSYLRSIQNAYKKYNDEYVICCSSFYVVNIPIRSKGVVNFRPKVGSDLAKISKIDINTNHISEPLRIFFKHDISEESPNIIYSKVVKRLPNSETYYKLIAVKTKAEFIARFQDGSEKVFSLNLILYSLLLI